LQKHAEWRLLLLVSDHPVGKDIADFIHYDGQTGSWDHRRRRRYNDLAGRNGSWLCGTQRCRGIVRWAHRDDERSAEASFCALPRPHRIGRPLCLENPRPKGGILTSGERPSPFQAEPTHSWSDYRCLVCQNMAFSGDFQPVLAKHSKNFSLLNALSIGIDQMQRNFEPMKRQIETWRELQLTDAEARMMIIYEAFIEGELCVPQYLGRTVHDRYFNPHS
jgi:hypothetical protein